MKDYLETASAAMTVPAFDRPDRQAMLQGLIYGIAHIDTLPNERCEKHSMLAMCDLVRRITVNDDTNLAYILWGVEHHVGFEIDLWPIPGGPGPNGSHADEEIERCEAVRKWINEAKVRFAESGALADAPPSDVVRFL